MRNVVLILSALSVSCTSTIPSLTPYKLDIQQGNVVNAKMMSQLRPGMTKSQVRFIMGTPLVQDSFHKDRWDYFYQMRKGDKVVEQRRVILEFENEVLARVRGDVVPASNNPDSLEPAPMVSLAPQAKPEEKKGLLDKLKFWGDDKDAQPESAAKPEVKTTPTPAASVEVAKPAVAAVAAAAVAATAVTSQEPTKVDNSASNTPTKETAALPVSQQPSPAPISVPAVQPEPIKPEPIKPTVAPIVEDKPIATPAAAEVPKANANLMTEDAVRANFDGWVNAWRSKNVKAYLAYYADSFVPDALPTRKEWVAQRKQRLSKRGDISLTVDDVKVNLDGNRAVVDFVQHYSAAGYSDNVRKLLKYELIGSNWLIVREAVIDVKSNEIEKLKADAEASAKSVVITAPALNAASASVVSTASNPDAAVNEQAVNAVVNAWAEAWKAKDVAAYLASYSQAFVPEGGMSRKAWVAQRKQRLAKPDAITLVLDGVKINVVDQHATVTFVQSYSTKGYSDNVSKLLEMDLEGKTWRITKETVLSTLKKVDNNPDAQTMTSVRKLTPNEKSEAPPVYPEEPKAEAPAPSRESNEEVLPEPASEVVEPSAKVDEAATKASDDAKAKKANPEEKPGFLERMLEKIGF